MLFKQDVQVEDQIKFSRIFRILQELFEKSMAEKKKIKEDSKKKLVVEEPPKPDATEEAKDPADPAEEKANIGLLDDQTIH